MNANDARKNLLPLTAQTCALRICISNEQPRFSVLKSHFFYFAILKYVRNIRQKKEHIVGRQIRRRNITVTTV